MESELKNTAKIHIDYQHDAIIIYKLINLASNLDAIDQNH
jgi:hypothetical protein